MWDFRNYKINKTKILAAILFLVLAFLVVGIYVVKNRLYQMAFLRNPFNFDVPYDRLDTCEEDADCILIDYQGCYTDKKPINKRYHKQYLREPYWQKDLNDCVSTTKDWFVDGEELKCRVMNDGAKRCTTQIDVKAATNLEECIKKFDFLAKGETCDENCEADKAIYVVYVGGGGIHEEIMAKSSYMERGYKGIFPEEINNKVIAVYDTSQCNPCKKHYFIRQNLGIDEVDLYRFCYYLAEQDSICGNCSRIEKITPKEEATSTEAIVEME